MSNNSNNNVIFEKDLSEESHLKENWRQIPIKVFLLKKFFKKLKKIKKQKTITFPVDGEHQEIIEEDDHCLRIEKRQRTPSGENVAMIFERQRSYRQKEKSENG